jgi:hypothetical protein
MSEQAAALTPRRRPPGTANRLDPQLAEAIADPPDGTEWGPAMKALKASCRHPSARDGPDVWAAPSPCGLIEYRLRER